MTDRPFTIEELEGAGDGLSASDRAEAFAVARSIEAALSADPVRPQPGAAFTDRVMAAVAAVPAPHRRGLGIGGLLLAAAIAVGSLGGLVVAGGLGLFDQASPPSPEPSVMPSASPSPSPVESGSPSPSASPSASPSPSVTPSPSPSATPTATARPTTRPNPTRTPSPTDTPEPTDTETPEPTGTEDSPESSDDGGGNSGPG